MNDGSLTMFAELPGLRKQNGSSSKTLEEYLPQTVGTLLPGSVQQWHTTVSADGNGGLFERQTLEHPTKETDGSALLPTPTVQDGENTAGESQWTRNSQPLNVIALRLDEIHSYEDLRNKAQDLLPTPTVEQGRSLTSGMATGDGRKPGSTGLLGTTLNDVVFLDRLANTNKQSNTGNKSLEDDLHNQATIFD